MLAICTRCGSAQDVHAAGMTCWFCEGALTDPERVHEGERGDLSRLDKLIVADAIDRAKVDL